MAAVAEYEIAKAEIDDAIETFCNRTRRHRHLSGVSPEVFEAVSNRRLALLSGPVRWGILLPLTRLPEPCGGQELWLPVLRRSLLRRVDQAVEEC
jgi:hypothetical protein